MTIGIKEFKIEGDPLPAGAVRTLTGAQLSSSGQHLSTTGSGIRRLFEGEGVPDGESPVPITEEMARPSFARAQGD